MTRIDGAIEELREIVEARREVLQLLAEREREVVAALRARGPTRGWFDTPTPWLEIAAALGLSKEGAVRRHSKAPTSD